jgi:hypothetical protein
MRLTARAPGQLGFFFLVLAGGGGVDQDFLAVLQISIDGLVAAGNNLLAFLQSLGDFDIVVVTDAAFDGNLLDVIAFDDEDDFNRFGRFVRFLGRDGIGGAGVWSAMLFVLVLVGAGLLVSGSRVVTL